MLTDGTKSIDCEFEENGALPACGYETAPNSKLNWTLRSHGKTINVWSTKTNTAYYSNSTIRGMFYLLLILISVTIGKGSRRQNKLVFNGNLDRGENVKLLCISSRHI